jgi:methionyl-tRNA synthetase
VTSRIVALCDSGFGGQLPPPSGRPEAMELSEAAARSRHCRAGALPSRTIDFSGGLAAIWKSGRPSSTGSSRLTRPGRSRRIRRRGQDTPPVLRGAAEALLQIAAHGLARAPGACAEIASRLGTSDSRRSHLVSLGTPPRSCSAFAKRGPLFARVDKAGYFQVDHRERISTSGLRRRYPRAAPAPAAAAGPETITIDDFLRVDLRVARVVSAERIEGADKLLNAPARPRRNDTGRSSPGSRRPYTPEQLVGKAIVVVANLKPAKLRGVESQGMLLAADLDRAVRSCATFEEGVAAGTRVR